MSAFQSALVEMSQGHALRAPLIKQIQEARNERLVISFFISFRSKAPLGSEDADMIEEVLLNSDTSKGVTLILDAPGGEGLAAERIIQLCKSYSKKDFETIVPARAKSAATMVCLGSDRILMAPTSELGPIDPQIPLTFAGHSEWVSAHHIIRTYEALMKEAVALKDGRIEPFLQQLSQFNSVQIQRWREATELSKSIAVKSLRRGMLKAFSEKRIGQLINCFTDPDITHSHGRALTLEHLKPCKLNIEKLDLASALWKSIRNLYTRSIVVVDRIKPGAKILETIDKSFSTQGG